MLVKESYLRKIIRESLLLEAVYKQKQLKELSPELYSILDAQFTSIDSTQSLENEKSAGRFFIDTLYFCMQELLSEFSSVADFENNESFNKKVEDICSKLIYLFHQKEITSATVQSGETFRDYIYSFMNNPKRFVIKKADGYEVQDVISKLNVLYEKITIRSNASNVNRIMQFKQQIKNKDTFYPFGKDLVDGKYLVVCPLSTMSSIFWARTNWLGEDIVLPKEDHLTDWCTSRFIANMFNVYFRGGGTNLFYFLPVNDVKGVKKFCIGLTKKNVDGIEKITTGKSKTVNFRNNHLFEEEVEITDAVLERISSKYQVSIPVLNELVKTMATKDAYDNHTYASLLNLDEFKTITNLNTFSPINPTTGKRSSEGLSTLADNVEIILEAYSDPEYTKRGYKYDKKIIDYIQKMMPYWQNEGVQVWNPTLIKFDLTMDPSLRSNKEYYISKLLEVREMNLSEFDDKVVYSEEGVINVLKSAINNRTQLKVEKIPDSLKSNVEFAKKLILSASCEFKYFPVLTNNKEFLDEIIAFPQDPETNYKMNHLSTEELRSIYAEEYTFYRLSDCCRLTDFNPKLVYTKEVIMKLMHNNDVRITKLKPDLLPEDLKSNATFLIDFLKRRGGLNINISNFPVLGNSKEFLEDCLAETIQNIRNSKGVNFEKGFEPLFRIAPLKNFNPKLVYNKDFLKKLMPFSQILNTFGEESLPFFAELAKSDDVINDMDFVKDLVNSFGKNNKDIILKSFANILMQDKVLFKDIIGASYPNFENIDFKLLKQGLTSQNSDNMMYLALNFSKVIDKKLPELRQNPIVNYLCTFPLYSNPVSNSNFKNNIESWGKINQYDQTKIKNIYMSQNEEFQVSKYVILHILTLYPDANFTQIDNLNINDRMYIFSNLFGKVDVDYIINRLMSDEKDNEKIAEQFIKLDYICNFYQNQSILKRNKFTSWASPISKDSWNILKMTSNKQFLDNLKLKGVFSNFSDRIRNDSDFVIRNRLIILPCHYGEKLLRDKDFIIKIVSESENATDQFVFKNLSKDISLLRHYSDTNTIVPDVLYTILKDLNFWPQEIQSDEEICKFFAKIDYTNFYSIINESLLRDKNFILNFLSDIIINYPDHVKSTALLSNLYENVNFSVRSDVDFILKFLDIYPEVYSLETNAKIKKMMLNNFEIARKLIIDYKKDKFRQFINPNLLTQILNSQTITERYRSRYTQFSRKLIMTESELRTILRRYL